MAVAFDISMAVKRGNKELRGKLNAVIAKKQKEIDDIILRVSRNVRTLRALN